MASYKTFMEIIHGSMQFEFCEDMQLTVSGYWSGDEAALDFRNMDEEMFEELRDEAMSEDIGYDDAMRILAGSKTYEFDEKVLSVTDYNTGDELRLDLNVLTEEMYEMLKAEEPDDDMEDDFTEAINRMGEGGPSL